MRQKIAGSTILVTGGAGFIGSHLVDRLFKDGASEIIVVDNLFTGCEDNLIDASKNNLTLYKDDIELYGSLEYIFEKHDIDIVFNCATKALNYSFNNPKNAFDTNTSGILNLLEFQRKKVFKTLVHFSTSEVYGTAIYEPMDEDHPLKPTTTYAAGKAAADIALETYVRVYGLDSIIVRPFNNYGPRQNYKGYLAAIIPITAWKLVNGISPEIHGTGNQSRDFIYVFDTIDAIVNVYDKLKPGESVNISTDGQVSVNSVIEKICEIMGYKGNVLRKEGRVSDVECHNASNKKIKTMIDYQLTDFDTGLKNSLDWYKKNIKR